MDTPSPQARINHNLSYDSSDPSHVTKSGSVDSKAEAILLNNTEQCTKESELHYVSE